VYLLISSSRVISENIGERIVGGEEATPYSLPFQVALVFANTNRLRCGGTIISESYIITAAHCVDDSWLTFQIVAAEHDLQNDRDDATRHNIEAIHVHPKWNDTTKDYDFALLHLQDQIDISESSKAKAIVLPKATDVSFIEGTTFNVSGWGDLISGGNYSHKLRYVTVPWVSDDLCQNAYSRKHITPRMLCAGDLLDGGVDTCQGDSGGPMTWLDPLTSEIKLVGVVSWGRGCAKPGYPGIYAEVSTVLDWIEQYVPQPQPCGNGYRLSQTDFKVEVEEAGDTQACSRACDNIDECISYEFSTPGQTCTLNSKSLPAPGEYKKRDLCVKEFFEDTIVVTDKLQTDSILTAGGLGMSTYPNGTKRTQFLLNPALPQNCLTLPDLPYGMKRHALVMTSDEHKILSCGWVGHGASEQCFELQISNGGQVKEWKFHSQFSSGLGGRWGANYLGPNAVSMSDGIYIFGYGGSQHLPTGTTQWTEGPIASDTTGTFRVACSVAISDSEILLIGGWDGRDTEEEYGKMVRKYNTETRTWTKMQDLQVPRNGHACYFYNKTDRPYIIISGGISANSYKSTEIYYLDGTTEKVGNFNQGRGHHALVAIDLPTLKVYAVGGNTKQNSWLDTVEEWQDATKVWQTTSLKLREKMIGVGALAVDSKLICKQ